MNIQEIRNQLENYQKGGRTIDPNQSSETFGNMIKNNLSYFFGTNNSNLKSSPYKPSTTTDPKARYNTYDRLREDVMNDLISEKLSKNIKYQQERLAQERKGYKPANYDGKSFDSYYNYLKNTGVKYATQGSSINLGKYKTDAGEDSNGRYISIYDKFDWDMLENLGFDGNKFEIYDRIYEKDWNDYLNKKQSGGKINKNVYYPNIDSKISDITKQKFLDVLNFENEYINSPKFRERVDKAGYEVDDYKNDIRKKLRNISFKIDNNPNTNLNGAYYNYDTNTMAVNSNLNNRDFIPHELGHVFNNLNLNDFIMNRNRLIPNNYLSTLKTSEKLKDFNYYAGEGHELEPAETSADVHAVRYELANWDQKEKSYDGRYSNFTEDAFKHLIDIAVKNPDSASRRLLDKVGYKLSPTELKTVKQSPNNDKEELELDKKQEELYKKRDEKTKQYIFDIMNRIVMNEKSDSNIQQAQKGGRIESIRSQLNKL